MNPFVKAFMVTIGMATRCSFSGQPWPCSGSERTR